MKTAIQNLSKPMLVLLTAGLALVSNLALAQLPYEYAQNSYRSGQHTEVAYEGWVQEEDGSYVLTFGYFNHNWEEELDIPIHPR